MPQNDPCLVLSGDRTISLEILLPKVYVRFRRIYLRGSFELFTMLALGRLGDIHCRVVGIYRGS